jgi:hypothetical protein
LRAGAALHGPAIGDPPIPPKANAFRKIAVVSFTVYFLHLYKLGGIGMYSGNATPFPASPQTTSAQSGGRTRTHGISRGLGAHARAAGVPTLPRRRGRPPRVPLRQLLPGLTFHGMLGAGTLSGHFFELFGDALADSSWSDRRQRLPWDIFADLLGRAATPIPTTAVVCGKSRVAVSR